MTDWQSLPFAIDLSHHNGVIDWDKVAAQKPACILLKATERQWTDPMFGRNRKACADRGLLWMPYAFLRPDDHERTIRYFLDLIGDPTIPAALDWEAPGVSSAVVEAWIDALPRPPLAYYGNYPPAAATDKIGHCPRWFPQYPGSATADPRLPMWDGSADPDWRNSWLIWQWSEKGAVSGISGNVDLNRLACSVERFAAWYKTGDFNAMVADPAPAVIADDPAGAPVGGILDPLSPLEKIKGIQLVLGVKQDGAFGRRSRAALNTLLQAAGQPGM